MKAQKMLGMWLALAAVVSAFMVLAGCPHNNLMERGEASGGGSGRSSNKDVQLVITNFASEYRDAGPSASYLNPQRTIAPDSIDLKNQGEVDKYVFIVEGSGNGTKFGPEFLDIDGATGTANLSGISGVGYWEITVSGYDVAKLQGKPGITGTDKADIVNQTQPDKVVDQKATALVLQGQATLDLNTGSRVTMTLTNDGVGTEGDVNLTINFDADDVQEINKKNYVVRVALYDYADGGLVGQTTGGHAENDYLQGRLVNPETFSVSVKKGHYQLRLTVTDDTDNSVKAFWTDNIYVEGNRDTRKEVDVHNLFGTAPEVPDSFNVYWKPADETELKEGFLATFTWSGLSYNAVGVDIEIADITEWYQYDMLQTQHKFNNFNGLSDQIEKDTLWEKIDGLSDATVPKKTDVVTEITWNNSPQGATKYPAIWKEGSQLNGSSEITFLMQHGHVYTARIRAAGAQTNSDWVVIGTGVGTPAPAGAPTLFNLPTTDGLFDLVQIQYDLENGKYLLKKTDGGTIGTDAQKTDLLQYAEYSEPVGTPIDITLKYSVNGMATPQRDDWFLYYATTPGGGTPTQLDERIRSWNGWRDRVGTTEITLNQNWEYSGYKSLHLVALVGNSVGVQAETSGTFDVLTKETVLVKIGKDAGQGNKNDWNKLVNGDDNPTTPGGGSAKDIKLSLEEEAAKNRFIINLDKQNKPGGAGGGTKTFLYVSAGKDITPDNVGVLDDKNGNPFTVKDITATLKQGGAIIKTFTKDAGGYSAHAELDGLRSGDYTLCVEILPSSGYEMTYQTTLAVKYNDQVIP